ncbi:hypothetical protein SF23_12805, partial [Streptomyces sp. MBRL 10]
MRSVSESFRSRSSRASSRGDPSSAMATDSRTASSRSRSRTEVRSPFGRVPRSSPAAARAAWIRASAAA